MQDAAAAQVDLAHAQYAQAQARLDELKINLANTLVTSPVNGFIGKRLLDPGAWVTPNSSFISVVDISVVPSIFPEAFGMVAAEAASAGVPPVVAHHSGLAEVAAGIADEYPADRRELVSFPTGDAVALRERLRVLLDLPQDERRALGLAARRAVERRWSWSAVAERLLEPFTT